MFSVRRWGAVAAGILLVIGFVLGLGFSMITISEPTMTTAAQEIPIKVIKVEGTILVKHQDSDSWKELGPESKVYLGDTLHSIARSTTTLAIHDESTITLRPNGTVTFKAYGPESDLYLEHGVLEIILQSPHPPLVISTPQGQLEALGTEFVVSVQ